MNPRIETGSKVKWLVLAALGMIFLMSSAELTLGVPDPSKLPAGGKKVALAPQMILGANGEGKKAQELLQEGRLAEAEAVAQADLHTAISRSGFSSFGLLVPYNNLGVVYTVEGKFADAHKMFVRAIGLGKAAVSQGEMASGYSGGSTYRQAGAGAGKGLTMQKKLLALCLFNNGLAYRKEGEPTKAERFEAEARKLDPSLPELK